MFRNEKGVTLVELLIVIVILGIIAAISVPAVGNIVENAEKDAVMSDATNIAEAAQLACSSEDWDACEDQSDTENRDSDNFFILGKNDSSLTGTTEDSDLADYLDSEPDNYFAVRYDGEWIVGVDTGEYYVYGNPDDLVRDNVVPDTDGDYGENINFESGFDYPSNDTSDQDTVNIS